jgi:protein-disulfide isomerase
MIKNLVKSVVLIVGLLGCVSAMPVKQKLYDMIYDPYIPTQQGAVGSAQYVLMVFCNLSSDACGNIYKPLHREVLSKHKNIWMIYKDIPATPVTFAASRLVLAAAKLHYNYWRLNNMFPFAQEPVTPELVLRYAQQLGMNTDRLTAASKGFDVYHRLTADKKAAESFGIRLVPAFIVVHLSMHRKKILGYKIIDGVYSQEAFRQINNYIQSASEKTK